jgi:hypothetical protein
MFQGTTPADVQKIFHEIVSGWSCKDIYIGCSGNFTIERVLHETGRFNLHSNDVSIYSGFLGSWLAGAPYPIRLTDEYADKLSWLKPYLETPEDALATVLLCTTYLTSYERTNAFYRRMTQGYERQWPELHKKTLEKVKGFKPRIASYSSMDVQKFAADAPEDQGFICFPPFYKSGYEVMWKKMQTVFQWEEPPYEVFDDAGVTTLFEQIRSKKFWIIANNKFRPEMAEYYRAKVKPTNRGADNFIYSGNGPARLVTPHQNLEPIPLPRLLRGDTIGDHMGVYVLKEPQFATLRSQYMNAHIAPGTPALSLCIAVDGRIVGGIAFKRDDIEGFPGMFLLSDFAVGPTDYPKLSKLVVAAVLSKEVKLLAERTLGKRVIDYYTAVFSNNPNSMKYRGLFEKTSSKPCKDGPFAYQLQYRGDAGRWTLDEALALRKQKYGEKG